MRCRNQLLFACVVVLLLAVSLCGVLEQAHVSHAPTTRYSSTQTKLAEKVLMIDEQQKTHIQNEEPLLSTSRIKTIHRLREVCDRQGEHLFLTNPDGSLKHNMNVRCVKMNPSQHACSCHLCSKQINSAANHLGRCMHRRRRFRTGAMLAGHVSCDYYQTSEKTVASQEAKKGVLDCLSIVSIVIMTQLSAHQGLKKKLKLMLGALVSGNSVDDVRKNTFFETEQKPGLLANVKVTVSKCIRSLYGDFPITHTLFFCKKNLTSRESPGKDRSGCDYFYSNHGSTESLFGKTYFGLTSFSVLQPPQHVYTVAPATVNTAFLPRRDDDMKSSMAYEGCRLASLASLPPSCTASRIRLAHAGFYYDVSNTTRNPDNQHELVCFACGVTCGRWDTGESPAEIHRRLSPDCSVAKSLPDVSRTVQSEISKSDGVLYPTSTYVTSGVGSNCSGGQMSTSLDSTSRACLMTSRIPRPQNYGVLDGSDSGDLTTDCAAIAPSSVSDEHHVTQPAAQAGPSYVTQRQTGRTFSEDRPVLSMDVAVYPQFSTSQSRLATFRNWPSHFFRPQMLVSLGFFYAGYADCIRCFYCGVGLKTWEPGDDVTEEHIRWRSDCGFILATRGRQFVQNVLARLQLTLDEWNTDDQQRQSEPRGPWTFHSPGHGRCSTFSPLAFTTTASREPRGVNSEALQRVQAMGFPPELVARAGEDIEATGCQEVDTNYVVERIVELLHTNDYTRDSRAAEESLELQSDGETPSERDSRLHQLRTENAELKARRTCRTCKVRVVGMIFLPCGHVVNCVQCGNKARHCCTCHDVIRATANIFLS